MYIFDIDGTLADCSHRLHLIQGAKKDWSAFHDAMVNDEPIKPTIAIINALNFHYNEFAFCTGRPTSHYTQTRNWLCEHVGEWTDTHPLYMRLVGDHTPDYEIKQRMLDFIRDQEYNPIAAFEDRQQCVDMWRRNGLICYQVAEGNY